MKPVTKSALYALALAIFATSALATTQPRKPNIVILLADDWGFSDVGAFGGEIATPNIDALAAQGVRFSNFHVAGSCSPTRAMLQTGVSSHRAGLGNMPETIPPAHQNKPGYDAVLNKRVITIGDRLRAGGYATYFTGKWHLGYGPDNLPNSRGYDRSFALTQSGADNFEDKANLLLYDYSDWNEDGKPAALPKDYYSSTFIIDRMISYIEGGRANNKPFLASINFLANHIPIQATDADIARYKARYDSGWSALRAARREGAIAKGVMPPGVPMVKMDTTVEWGTVTPAQRAQRAGAMAAYAAMGTAMDREIGRLVAHLKASGDYDNTVFVFLSDNGPEATDPMGTPFVAWNARRYYDQSTDQQGRKGSLTAMGAGFASAAASPLNGYKFTASEGGLRVPLIIAWPSNKAFKPGQVVSTFAHVTDIAPTLLAFAGVDHNQGLQPGKPIEDIRGYSLEPSILGATPARPADAPLGYELSGNAVLFRGDWKLVRNLPPYGSGQWQLFNIARDPGETEDLAKAEPELYAAMQADYAAYAKDDQVLDMPEGYQAPQQIMDNAISDLLVPRLLALWPLWLGIVASVSALIYWGRRRRAKIA